MRQYFEEEMRYLHEEAKIFAKRHPDQARYLNIDSINDRDPFVERLFEGFAFLSGKIHERLDDELPEYSEGFFSLLYPHFLKPIPSLSIAEFKPKLDQLSETTVLEKGSEIQSDAVGAEGVVCRFVTTESLCLRPLSLENVRLSLEEDNSHSAILDFKVGPDARIDSESLSSIRLFINADSRVAGTAHLFFTRHVKAVEFSVGSQEKKRVATMMGQQAITPGGFAEAEGLLPYSKYTFAGSRLLQEYFNFRARFWCFDLHGMDRIGPLSGDESIQVTVKFDKAYPPAEQFSTENIRLHCCPIINLFNSDADPVRVLPTESDYRVTADRSFRESILVYDIVDVVGVEEKTGRRRSYSPYYAFEREGGQDGRFFVESFRQGPDDTRASYISLTTEQDVLQIAEAEVLSITLRSTNGNIPREFLHENMLDRLGPGVPSIADVSNIYQPSQYLEPPLTRGKDYYWKLLAHLSLNRSSIASATALREMLRLYDWSGSDSNERRITGIEDVRWEGKDLVVRGSVIRGGQVIIDVNQDHFSDEGDLCLFGLVLSEFFSMYATINSFVHLKIVAKPSETVYEWKPNRGVKALL